MRGSVVRAIHQFRGVHASVQAGDEPYWTRSDLKDMDDRFSSRLTKAIAKGREHAPIGVVTSPGTAHPIYCLPLTGRVRGQAWGHE